MNLFQVKDYGVISFHSTHHALSAEKKLLDQGLNFLLIPLPACISASCGLAIKFGFNDFATIKTVLEKAGISWAGAYYIIREGNKQVVNGIDIACQEKQTSS